MPDYGLCDGGRRADAPLEKAQGTHVPQHLVQEGLEAGRRKGDFEALEGLAGDPQRLT